jgi:hypothetical protein
MGNFNKSRKVKDAPLEEKIEVKRVAQTANSESFPFPQFLIELY